MIDPSLTITLSREELGLGPLVLSGRHDQPIGITNYQEPGKQARIRSVESNNLHGSIAISAVWQQAILGFDVITDEATSETERRSLIRELTDALAQFHYTASVAVNDAPADVWTCDMGSIVPTEGRTYSDLSDFSPVYSVTIPVYPIASA